MPRRRMYFFRYMTMFFLGASAVMLGTYASVSINTSLNNAVQYISKIIVTSNGTNGGTTGVFIDGTGGGRIGIGTDDPVTKFQINGNSGSIYAGIRTNTENPYIFVNDDRNTVGGVILSDWSGVSFLKSLEQPLWLTTDLGGTPDLVIATGGNVGIGTDSPTEKFQVGDYAWIGKDSSTDSSTTGGSFLRLYGSHVGANLTPSHKETPNIQLNFASKMFSGDPWDYRNRMIDNDQGTLSFKYATGDANYTTNMVIDTNGNVGIGTSSPAAKLNVTSDDASIDTLNVQSPYGYLQFGAGSLGYGNGNVNLGITSIGWSNSVFGMFSELGKTMFSVTNYKTSAEVSNRNEIVSAGPLFITTTSTGAGGGVNNQIIFRPGTTQNVITATREGLTIGNGGGLKIEQYADSYSSNSPETGVPCDPSLRGTIIFNQSSGPNMNDALLVCLYFDHEPAFAEPGEPNNTGYYWSKITTIMPVVLQ